MTEFPHSEEAAGQPTGEPDAVNTEAVNDAVPRSGEAAGQPTGEPDAVNTDAVNDVVTPEGEAAQVASPSGDPAPSRGPDDAAMVADAMHPDAVLAAERLEDLQRLNAEYVNYKRRVDRDRPFIQERAIQDVIEALLPVLDDIQGARDHGELSEGPFAAIADKLETTLRRFGAERFGAVGEEFDPLHHEALMHVEGADLPEGVATTTVVQVLQPGYRVGTRIIRPARVAVTDPA